MSGWAWALIGAAAAVVFAAGLGWALWKSATSMTEQAVREAKDE